MGYITVTPNPFADESLAGFLVRLAKRNGFSQVQELMTLKQFGYLCRGNGALFDNTVEEYELESLLTIFKSKHAKSVPSYCKVCPSCMLEKKHVLECWQSEQTYHCTKHNVVLVDTCLRCNERLSWEIPILDAKCTNENCRALLPSRESLLTLMPKERFSDCLKAAKWARQILLANDAMSSAEIIEFGYQFLSSNHCFSLIIKKYLEQTEKFSMYPSSLRYFTALMLINQLSDDWPAKVELAQGIKLQMSNIQVPNSVCFPELFIPKKVLSDYTDGLLNSTRLWGLISKYGKKRKSQNDYSTEPEYSLDILISTLKSNSRSNKEKSYSLRNWSSVVSSYSLSLIDIVQACCENKITYDFNTHACLIDAITLSELDLRKFVISFWERNKICYLDPALARTICRLNESEMIDACREGLLKSYSIHKNLPPSYKKRDVLNLAKVLDYQMPLPINEAQPIVSFQSECVSITPEGRPPS